MNYDMDKILCANAFEVYVLRKRILELKIKARDEVNPIKKEKLLREIEELRMSANKLSNYENIKRNKKSL